MHEHAELASPSPWSSGPARDSLTLRDAIARESARFVDALTTCAPDARVPACPAWAATDLLDHLTGVQWFWEQVLLRRPAPPTRT